MAIGAGADADGHISRGRQGLASPLVRMRTAALGPVNCRRRPAYSTPISKG